MWACGGQRSTLGVLSQEPSVLISLFRQGLSLEPGTERLGEAKLGTQRPRNLPASAARRCHCQCMSPWELLTWVLDIELRSSQ